MNHFVNRLIAAGAMYVGSMISFAKSHAAECRLKVWMEEES